MSASKYSSETATEISYQEIALVRSVERHIGKRRFIFWHGGGEVFCGRCSHMRALRSARESAPGVFAHDRGFNKKAKA